MVKAKPRPLYPQKETRFPLNRRLSGSQSRCGLARTVSLPLVSDLRTVQSVEIPYTNYVIQDPCYRSSFLFSCFGWMVKYVEFPCHLRSAESDAQI